MLLITKRGAGMIESLRKALPAWMTAWGFALAFAAFIGWIVTLLVREPISLSSGIIAALVSVFLLIYVGTALHLILGIVPEDFVKPRVKLYRKQGANSPAIFLFSAADWLSYKAAYTMFVLEDDGFERFMGIAHVFNVQNDKSVQVVVPVRAPASETVWSSLDAGSRDYFKSIVLKPGVPIDD